MPDFLINPNAFESFHDPTDWLVTAKTDIPNITEQKTARALAVGVPAVLFSAEQVTARIDELAAIEKARYLDPDYKDILYVVIEKGGWPLAADYFQKIGSSAPRSKLDTDSLGIKPVVNLNRGRPELKVVKPLSTLTRLTDRSVVLVDVSIRRGHTAEAIRGSFMDREWTVHHQLGSAARSMAIRSLTKREDSELTSFADSDVDIGFLTPKGVETAGKGFNERDESLRWEPEIFMSAFQPKTKRDDVAEALELLGDHAVMTIDEINWTTD